MKYIIFDFDGTLANTYDLALDIANDYIDDFGLPHFTAEQIKRARSSPLRDVLREHGLTAPQVALAAIAFQKKLAAHKEKLKPIKGVEEVVHELSKTHKMGIISSNNKGIIVEFLQRYGMDYFDPIVGGASLFGKPSKIKKVMKNMKYKPNEVVYVGDEVRDVEAAKKVGVGVISVTWGFNDKGALERSEPDHIISEPRELIKLVG